MTQIVLHSAAFVTSFSILQVNTKSYNDGNIKLIDIEYKLAYL